MERPSPPAAINEHAIGPQLAWTRGSLQPPGAFGAEVGVWVGDANPLGRAVEVCVEPGADEAATGLPGCGALATLVAMTTRVSLYHR